jgi:hypothetical protein
MKIFYLGITSNRGNENGIRTNGKRSYYVVDGKRGEAWFSAELSDAKIDNLPTRSHENKTCGIT